VVEMIMLNQGQMNGVETREEEEAARHERKRRELIFIHI
jgi:hypothetical protein